MIKLWRHTFFVIVLLLFCCLLNGLFLTTFFSTPVTRAPQSVHFFGYEPLTLVKLFFFLSNLLCLAALTLFLKIKVFKPLRELDRILTDLNSASPIGVSRSPSPSLTKIVNSLEDHVQRLRDNDKARSDFFNMATHELRTPLTSIRGSLRLLSRSIESTCDQNNLKLLHIAEDESDRLIRLTTNLLDLAKIEAKERSLKPEWLDIAKTAKHVAEVMQRHHEDHGVSLQVESLNESFEVFVDTDTLKQILMNLISNAIKYSPKHGIVYVHFEIQPEKGLVVKVSDQGCGIPPQEMHLIFEKFKQSSNSSKTHMRGTGLGLTIVKALVEQLEGQLGVESEPGKGSTFFFILPQWRQKQMQGRAA